MVASEVHVSSLQCLLKARREKRVLGARPPKMFWTTSFQSKESALFDIIRVLKGHFCSFAEKGRGPDPQHPIMIAKSLAAY